MPELQASLAKFAKLEIEESKLRLGLHLENMQKHTQDSKQVYIDIIEYFNTCTIELKKELKNRNNLISRDDDSPKVLKWLYTGSERALALTDKKIAFLDNEIIQLQELIRRRDMAQVVLEAEKELESMTARYAVLVKR